MTKKYNVIGGAITKSVDSDVSGLVAREHGAAGSGPRGNSSKCQKIRIGALNVGTINDKTDELTGTFSRRKLGLCCVQKIRYKTLLKIVDVTGSEYKFYGSRLRNKLGGVGVLVAGWLLDNIIEVTRVSDRIILLRLFMDKKVFVVVCVYDLQSNLSDT